MHIMMLLHARHDVGRELAKRPLTLAHGLKASLGLMLVSAAARAQRPRDRG
jgi:hypothetical protein